MSLPLGLFACAFPTGSEPAADPAADELAGHEVLAEADVEGGKAKFLAVDSDTLLIVTDTVGVPTPLGDPALRGLNAAETFEYWTGQAAPAELSERALRVWEADGDVPNADALEATVQDAPPEVGRATQGLTGPEFGNQFCRGAQYCWLNRTGSWERDERARYWLGYVDAVRGDITIRMRRRDAFGNWSTLWHYDVPSGHVIGALGATSGALNRRHLKFSLYNADGDLWHAALTWDP